MPEGPEVRRHAQKLASALEGGEVVFISARTQQAKKWLLEHPGTLLGRKIERIASHGKHLFGIFEGGWGFHSHLMMWGRWFIYDGAESVEVDRRERARIVTEKSIAVLFSAPVFDIFQGDPYEQIENLQTLGPDILPYEGAFDRDEFLRRLFDDEHQSREIGAVLLDQRVLAGVGNYLRAEILFFCGLSPWRVVSSLKKAELKCLCATIASVARQALDEGGATISPAAREKMRTEAGFTYGTPTEWNTQHAVFRRTNLPCLECGQKIRQKRQVTYKSDDGDEENDRSRIIYFCPQCQNVSPKILAAKSKRKTPKKLAPLS